MTVHNIALLGAGRIGKIHAANARAVPRLSLKYIVDPFEESARQLAQSTGAEVTNLDEALADPQITGVVVASSTDMHLEHCLRAIAAGKSVFCEKPIDLDLRRAQAETARLGGPDLPLFAASTAASIPIFVRCGSA